ncbi:MAG TPA: DUF4147 domain-containing protein, partial [Terriglobales bacterium]|nr:DUF4147 domain-containing protein [Terriglobales bacterium]
ELAEGGHPLPTAAGVAATGRLTELVEQADSGILCLFSGGASSLMVAPRPPLALAEKIAVNRMLLASGCTIDEINTVRKHLSQVKGGGLLALGGAEMATLLLSDVIGDDPSVIASGPTTADPTTHQDAWDILQRYDLIERLPAAVTELLQRGRVGSEPETIKPDNPRARRNCNLLIGSNRLALAAAERAAAELGWQVTVVAEPLQGDTETAASDYCAILLAGQGRRCVLAGGETTVRVTGEGKGGRNQHFALAALTDLAGKAALLLSAGSDGIDGPTDAAGAFADGDSAARAAKAGLSASSSLSERDSYSFFAALGDLFQPGPTGTNVMDLKIGFACD